MDKQNVVHTSMEYYSLLKGKEIQTHATRWMKLEGIMQSQKDKYHMIPLIRGA